MSILLRGMEMPEDCVHCFMPCEYRLPLESALVGKRMDDCPLVEVHAPHGRLIDADELDEIAWRERLDTRERISNLINAMPTIIEAEEEE